MSLNLEFAEHLKPIDLKPAIFAALKRASVPVSSQSLHPSKNRCGRATGEDSQMKPEKRSPSNKKSNLTFDPKTLQGRLRFIGGSASDHWNSILVNQVTQ
jgi:hypothetical protein